MDNKNHRLETATEKQQRKIQTTREKGESVERGDLVHTKREREERGRERE